MKKKTKEKVTKEILKIIENDIQKIEKSKIKSTIFVIYWSLFVLEILFNPIRFIPVLMLVLGCIYIFLMIYIRISFKEYYDSKYRKSSENTFFDTYWDIGVEGEFYTYQELEKLERKNEILTNLYIPKKNTEYSQIDLLIVDETGIYVCESKNVSGWIFGSENDEYWTVSLRNKKYKIYNPILQNEYHIKYLKQLLNDENLEEVCFKSYIVLSERCEIKKMKLFSDKAKVLKRDNFLEVLNMDIENSKKVLSNEQVNKIYSKLKQYVNNEESFHEQHIKTCRENYLT